MWRLLDQPQLDDRWHDRFSEFVFGNWDMFIDFNRRFFGKDDGLSTLIQRLGDKSFPDSKRWVYFCCAPAATDSATARALLELGLQSADARTRQVCTRLLRDGWSETAHDDDSHGQLSNAEGASYVAEAVVAVLRRGQRPEHSDSDSLNRLPIVDLIRRLIGDEDLIWVLAAAGTSEGATRGFFTSLLRNHATRQDVQATLREWWAEADAFTRAHLMWRILDDPALPQQWHKQLFEFVFENWAIFNEVSLKFVGDSSTVVTEALKRLQDRSVPTSKQWAYLCRVPGASNDADAARALVTIGQQSADDFTRTVADRLLSKFYAGRVSSVHQVQ